MTTLYIVRHGEARGNVERIFHGWFDSALTENGYAQIARLPAYFADIPLDAAYASDLKRAQETAQIVAKEKGLSVQLCPELREIHGGQWENVPWDDLPLRFADSYENWLSHPHLLEMPDGETMVAFQERIYNAVMRIAKEYEGKNVLIATHGTAIKVLLCKVRGIPLSKMPGEAWCDNASVTVLEKDTSGLRVVADGDNRHLADISTLAKQNWWRGGKDGERMREIKLTNRVHLTPCKSYKTEQVEAALSPMLTALLHDNGFSEDFTGKKVVIKPNLLLKRAPSQGVTTHPTFVQAAAAYFKARGASVMVADSPGGLYHPRLLQKIYDGTGMTEAAKAGGATLNLDTAATKVDEFTMIQPLVEADLIVNLARMKTHMLCNMTAAVKNLFGSIAGTKKAEYHAKYPNKRDFCDMLVRLCLANAPQINIIDGVVAMEGNGPAGGTLRKVGVILGSANPFAADLLCTYLMGFSEGDVLTTDIAKERGLCPKTVEELEIVGADPKPFVHKMKRPRASRDAGLLKLLPRTFAARIRREKQPFIVEHKCIGCGECVRCCPAETMELINRKATIHRENCIKCYCCQELCPQKAVVVK